MYIFKQPGGINGGAFTRRLPLVTLYAVAVWDVEGAALPERHLWVEPGGHRGPLRERFVKRGGAGAGGAGHRTQ